MGPSLQGDVQAVDRVLRIKERCARTLGLEPDRNRDSSQKGTSPRSPADIPVEGSAEPKDKLSDLIAADDWQRAVRLPRT
jgi:hypothetical protein